MSEPTPPSNFIRTIIDADLAEGRAGAFCGGPRLTITEP